MRKGNRVKTLRMLAVFIAAGTMFISGTIVSLPSASASSSTISAVSSPTGPDTKACAKAKKNVEKKRKAYRAARHQPSFSVLNRAFKKYKAAQAQAKKACTPGKPAPVPSVIPWNPETYDEAFNNPWSPGFMRPPDGSGYPYSNAAGVTVIGGCPITVSKIVFEKGPNTAYHPNDSLMTIYLENSIGKKDGRVPFTLTVIIADPQGNPITGNGTPSGIYIQKNYNLEWASAGSTIVAVSPKVDISTARLVRATVTCL